MQQSLSKLTITQPDDWHLHLRDGEALAAVVGATAKHFARAIVMPNLKTPVTQVAQALEYKARIDQALHEQNIKGFTPLMTLYLTDNTRPEEVHAAHASGVVKAFKLYPAGATTNSAAGVTDLLGKCDAVLSAMQAVGMPLLVHGEVTSPDIDVFDREKIFIDQVMIPLRQRYPELAVIFEHITTKDAADYVHQADGKIAATITPQHLMYNRNALFKGGIRPHWYCLPILKRETHREALVKAATSGSPRFFLGTDSAPHAKALKEHACGCAGCFTAEYAIAMYAQVFDQVGCIDRLEGFASHYGADFYGLARNTQKITLLKQSQSIPLELPFGQDTIVPLAAGETLSWTVAEVN